MKNKFLGLIAAVFLSFSIPVHAEPLAEHMAFVCEKLDVDCSKIPLPMVAYSLGTPYLGFFDHVNAPGVIFLDYDNIQQIDSDLAEAVITHELTHYVEYHANVYNFKKDSTGCKTEKDAFLVADAWLFAHDRPDLMIYDTWKLTYGCK